MKTMPRLQLFLTILGCGLIVSAMPATFAATPAVDPGLVLQRVRATELAPAEAVSLRDVRIPVGPAIFDVQRGVLVPARAMDGRVVELVFVGQARFLLEAPDEIEAGQLELFTGERSLDAPVEEAVLLLADESAIRNLLERPAPREMRLELTERIVALHDYWLHSTERRKAGVDAALFRSLIGDPAYASYFAVWARSFELGDFVYQLDPEDVEQITLAAFEALDLTGWERARLRHHIRVQQRKGRWLDMRVEDLGSWDIWTSMEWSRPGSDDVEGGVGFETEHYELEVKIKKRTRLLEGRARLKLRTEVDGRRVVRLEMLADLEASRVADGQGNELFHFRAGDDLLVLLPEPSRAGERLTLDVEYKGRALDWITGKYFDLRNTSRWHPHCGTVDRATYDVTLRWPAKLQVLASGKLTDAGRDGAYIWQRRKLDAPAIAFSFVLGKFEIERRKIGDVDLTMAFNSKVRYPIEEPVRQRTIDTVTQALEYFETVYGDYPLDHLTLVTVPRGFSQSYLGFITLAESIVQQPDPLGGRASWMRDTTIAHEMAHQWWGNLVGWWSYRDQWLSEGMANYSALVFDSHKNGGDADRLATMSAGWRESLGKTTLEGRTVESLGPIVLGNRLNSSRARNAYSTIVYRKGAVVLAMLARAVGEDRFLQMLHSLTEAASGRVLTTDSFLKSLERMSGLELDGFARQYVYGTGIPEVYYGYDSVPDGQGGWTVQGEARLLSAPRYVHEIEQNDDGTWSVKRSVGTDYRIGPTTLMVPYRLTFDGRENLVSDDDSLMQMGQLTLEGTRDGFEIATDLRPVDLKLDPRGEILAWFYDSDREPKRVLRYQAEDLAAIGRFEEAESRYREALRLASAPLGPADPLRVEVTSPRVDGRTEDLKIRLSLARVMIEQGRGQEAGRVLDEVEAEVERNDKMLLRVEREALRSRLDIGRGDYHAAQRRLRKTLRLASPRRSQESWRRVLWQWRLNSERLAMTEAFSLLAVAAYETRDTDDLAWALREARDRGADVAALTRAAEPWMPELPPRAPRKEFDADDLLAPSR